MPKLPVVSGTEAIRALERLGYEQLRQKGSHVVLRRDTVGCVVPLHRELKAGTLAAILRQAQIEVDIFIGALER